MEVGKKGSRPEKDAMIKLFTDGGIKEWIKSSGFYF
jgi:hypothetical protein